MRFLLKLSAVLAGLLAVAVIGATIAVKRFFPPEKVRSLIAENAQKALHREVRIGDISLNLLQGLTVKDLEVSQPAGFKEGVFARAGSSNLKIQWRPLLRKKVVVDRIVLKGLRLSVRKKADGHFDFEDITGAGKEAPQAPKAAAGLPLELNIHETALVDGGIVYEDAGSGASWTVSDLNARVVDFSIEKPFGATVSLKAEGKGLAAPVSAALSFDGRIDLAGNNLEKASVAMKRLSVESFGVKLDASGSVNDLASPEADLKVHLADFKTAGLKPFGVPDGISIPAADLDSKLAVKGDDLRIESFQLKTRFGTVDASGWVRKLKSSMPQPELDATLKLDLPAFKSEDIAFSTAVPAGLAMPALQISGAVSGGLDQVRLRSLRLKLGATDIEADGTVAALRSGSPQLDLLVKCRSFSLDELGQIAPATREMKLVGGGLFAAGVQGTPAKPVLAGKLTYKGIGAVVAGLKLSDFGGTVKFDERRIDAPGIAGKIGAGTLAMDVTVKDYAGNPDLSVEGSLTQFDLDKFLAAKAAAGGGKAPEKAAPAAGAKPSSPIRAAGKFTVQKLTHSNAVANDLRLAWDLSGITPDMKSLSGSAKLDVGAGKLENLGKLAAQSVIVKVLMLPLVVAQKIGGIQFFPDLNNIGFDSIVGDYAFQNGLMTLRQSHFDSRSADVTAQGTIDLPAEKLDLVVTAQVGRVAPIEVEVKGTFDNPQSKPRVLKFIAEPAKQLLQRLIKR